MRIITLILGILGSVISVALALKWLSDASEMKQLIDEMRDAGLAGEVDSMIRAAYSLMVSAVLGIAGGIFTLKGKGKLGAILFAVATVLPAVFSPKSLVGTFLFAIAAVLALIAKPQRGASVA